MLDSGHSSGLSEALNKVESIHLGMYEDETSRVCRWHLPAAHFLESWGVERDYRGRFCYRQPVILPLYGGISPEEVLSGLLSSKGHLSTADNSPTHLSPVYHRARKCFERAVNPENKTAAWAQALQRGYSEETAYAPLSPQEETALGTAMMQTPAAPFGSHGKKLGTGMLELQFRADYSIGDGRWKRNAWMQECPDPITGVSWAASAQVSPATFLRLGGSDSGPMHCTLTAPSTQMEVILCPIPGVADNLIILPLGYGGINHVAERQENSGGYELRRQVEKRKHTALPRNRLPCLPSGSGRKPFRAPLCILPRSPCIPVRPASRLPLPARMPFTSGKWPLTRPVASAATPA